MDIQSKTIPNFILLLIAIAIGTFVRVDGIGLAPLHVDEYYFSKSVYHLMDTGVPRFESGGYYIRAVLQQYLTVPFVKVLSDPETALRIPALIFNLLAIPAIYLLGFRLGKSRLAVAAVLLFCLSIWEIEYARTARMYTGFQTIFLWYTLFLLRAIVDKDKSALPWLYGFSFICFFIYEGAGLLVLLNFTPFLLNKCKVNVWHLLINFTLLALFLALRLIDFRYLGHPNPHLPESIVKMEESLLQDNFPPLMVFTFFDSPLWTLFFVILLGCFIAVLVRLWKSALLSLHERVSWSAIMICVLFNQLALASLLLGGALLLKLIELRSLKTYALFPYRNMMITGGAIALFYVIYGVTNKDALYAVSNINTIKYSQWYFHLGAVFLNYPEIFKKILKPWFLGMPVLTASSSLVLIFGFISYLIRSNQYTDNFRYLFALLICLIILVGIIPTTYNKARYTFFFYPIILLLNFYIIKELVERFVNSKKFRVYVYFGCVAIFMLITEDFGINHLANISTPEIIFRKNYRPELQEIYYPRRDNETPAEYINNNRGDNDLIVADEVTPVDFYLKNNLDYIFLKPEAKRFQARSVDRGRTDIWTNARLLYKNSDLFHLLDNSERPVWLITYSRDWTGREISKYKEKYQPYLVYVNVDETIDVYLIPPKHERIKRQK